MKLTAKQITHIKQEVVLDDRHKIVRINVSDSKKNWSKHEETYNIYRVDADFNIIWEVTEPKVARFDECDPFYYLGRRKKGENVEGFYIVRKETEIIGIRFGGLIYVIEPDTGVATNVGFNMK